VRCPSVCLSVCLFVRCSFVRLCDFVTKQHSADIRGCHGTRKVTTIGLLHIMLVIASDKAIAR